MGQLQCRRLELGVEPEPSPDHAGDDVGEVGEVVMHHCGAAVREQPVHHSRNPVDVHPGHHQ